MGCNDVRFDLFLAEYDKQWLKQVAAAQAAVREACAVAAECERTQDAARLEEWHESDPKTVDRYWLGWNDAGTEIAAAIRARGVNVEEER